MMENWNKTESPECRAARVALSDYIENSVSARDAWNIEKHLTSCMDCAQFLREMQATVSLLQAAPRFDTADDFMARLHAQLDSAEPEAMRPLSRFAAWRDRLADFGDLLRNPRIPALGLSLSAAALVSVLAVNQFAPAQQTAEKPSPAAAAPAPPLAVQQLNHNVALSASNPFDDPAAANLEANSQNDENESAVENQSAGS